MNLNDAGHVFTSRYSVYWWSIGGTPIYFKNSALIFIDLCMSVYILFQILKHYEIACFESNRACQLANRKWESWFWGWMVPQRKILKSGLCHFAFVWVKLWCYESGLYSSSTHVRGVVDIHGWLVISTGDQFSKDLKVPMLNRWK